MSDSLDHAAPSPMSPGAGIEYRSTTATTTRRLQFSLAGLFMLTALLAVGMVLLKFFGHWGLVVITAASFAFTLLSTSWWENASTSLFVSLLWGVGLPLLCFGYDPGIINSHSDFGVSIIALAIWQMALLLCWLLVGPRGPALNGFLAGGMIVGTLLAALIAIPMLFLALMMTFFAYAYGLPGFIPLMTTWIYARSWSQASFCIPPTLNQRGRFQTAFGVGIVTALLIPPLVVWLLSSFVGPIHFPKLPQPGIQLPFDWH